MMDYVITDTDVISFLFKHDTRHQLYRTHLAGTHLAVSFMTIAELDLCADLHNWGQ